MLELQDGQDRTTFPRCNVKGDATFPSPRRPKFGIVGVVGALSVPCLKYLKHSECLGPCYLGDCDSGTCGYSSSSVGVVVLNNWRACYPTVHG